MPPAIPPAMSRVRRGAEGSFARSILASAARGTGLIAVAVIIGIVLLQWSDDGPDRLAGGREPVAGLPGAVASTSSTTTTAPLRPPGDLKVLVLNASGRANQARPMSERLGVVGYRMLTPGNAPRQVDTVALCRPGLEREAAALVAATGVPANPGPLPADTKLPGVAEADCVVVIGSR